MKFTLLAVGCVLSVALAHTTHLCTLTSPSNPGAFVVAVGTYHPASERLPNAAQALLGPSDRAAVPSKFGSGCDLGGRLSASSSLAATLAKVKAKCGQKTYTSGGVRKNYVYSDSVLVCYDTDPGQKSNGQVEYLSSSPKAPACFDAYNGARTFYFVAVEGEQSGVFSMQWKSPGVVLDGYSNGIRPPCKTVTSKKNFLSITIPDGKKSCPVNARPIPSGIDPVSLASCGTTSGSICDGKCLKTGDQRLGTLICEDGKWINNQMCSSNNVCLKPSSLSGVTNGPAAVSGAGCGTLTVAGSTCEMICNRGYQASNGGTIKCTDSGKKGIYGGWSKVGKVNCQLVPCPAGSTGTSIVAGCKCLPGYQGGIVLSTAKPFFTGGCKLPTKPPTKSPTTVSPTAAPITASPTTASPTIKPYNCFVHQKKGNCNGFPNKCFWDNSRKHGACVPACDSHSAGEHCNKLLGCKWVTEEGFGWCENKDTDKLIKKHKKKRDKTDRQKAKQLMKKCSITESIFCPEPASLTIRDCNIDGGTVKSVCCRKKTGLLECHFQDCHKKCQQRNLHPRTCIAYSR